MMTAGIVIAAWALMLRLYYGVALWLIVTLFEIDSFSTAAINVRLISAGIVALILSYLTWNKVKEIVED